jgi:benzodiazapine receptor
MDQNLINPTRTGPVAWLGLALWLGLCFAAAWIGSRFQPGEWYRQLVKPSLTPPSWVFGAVWTILYVLMGVAAWLVWRRYGLAGAALPLGLFIGQLALNALWSYLFFGRHQPGPAFLDIIALWLTLLATLIAFWHLYPPAGQLLLPYLLWVTFAACLNVQIWRLNA